MDDADSAFENLVQAVTEKLPSSNLVSMALKALPGLDSQDSVRLCMTLFALQHIGDMVKQSELSLENANIMRTCVIKYIKALAVKADE